MTKLEELIELDFYKGKHAKAKLEAYEIVYGYACDNWSAARADYYDELERTKEQTNDNGS